jgi:pentatricopeptide repeat protein
MAGNCYEQLIQSHCESDVFVWSSLVDIYEKCGSIEDAWKVFQKMPSQNVGVLRMHAECSTSKIWSLGLP